MFVMSASLNLKMDPQKLKEVPLVDVAFMVLKAANTPYYYRDLMNEVANQRGMSEKEINEYIAQLYTEINIDGRFACVGTNLWGLKRWYPVDRSEDSVSGVERPRIINDDDDLEDEDFSGEENYNQDDEFDDSENHQDDAMYDEDESDDAVSVGEEEVEDNEEEEDADCDEKED